MYCSTCAAPLTPGISYCNRCGANLKEGKESVKNGVFVGFLTAITLIAICGLGIMLGGALALKKDGEMPNEVVGIFMFMTFFLVLAVEFFLCRQLSRLAFTEKALPRHQPQTAPPHELRAPQQRGLPEPVPSVTENTTRTLEYSRDEALRR
jgi:hypothetical protein